MRISFVALVEGTFPARLNERARPLAAALDRMLHGSDDRAVSQRIAMIAFAVRVLSAVIAYVSQVLLARWMGDFEYGIFVVVWVGAVILGGLACLGFQTAIVRFVPEYIERGETQLLRGVSSAAASTASSPRPSSPPSAGSASTPSATISRATTSSRSISAPSRCRCWPSARSRTGCRARFSLGRSRPVADLHHPAGAHPRLHVGGGALGWPPNAVTAMAAVIVATYLTSIGQLIWLERRIRSVVPRGPRLYQPMLWVGIALPIFIVEGFFNLLTNVDIIIVGN